MAKCAFSAPHSAVTDIGMDLLRSGASAIDAMLGAAAAVAVAYPHMNGLGGDAFWLISAPGKAPFAIDGAGVTMGHLHAAQFAGTLPNRGPQACITLPGAVASWDLARQQAGQFSPCAPRPLAELLAPAMALAKTGVEVTPTLSRACHKLHRQLAEQLGQQANLDDSAFAELARRYMQPVLAGQQRVSNPALVDTLQQLEVAGCADFYRGDIAQALTRDINHLGVGLEASDLAHYAARPRSCIEVALRHAKVYNLPAPTQGFASLLILGLFDRLYQAGMDESSQIHLLVEATKKAFTLRDAYLGDSLGDAQSTPGKEAQLLEPAFLDQLAGEITATAAPWPEQSQPGDTVWMGCVDQQGLMVSFIQSLYWEFGAGLMSPATGIIWNNRGCSFSLAPGHPNELAPGKRPLHTLNPAYAEFKDGRRLVYGSMGGDGQPQTQAALYTRFAYQNLSLARAIGKDRWLLGRTWGDYSTDLKIEQQLAAELGDELMARGHSIRSVPAQNEMMGHAGAICLAANGEIDCASDPRSDGKAVSFGK